MLTLQQYTPAAGERYTIGEHVLIELESGRQVDGYYACMIVKAPRFSAYTPGRVKQIHGETEVMPALELIKSKLEGLPMNKFAFAHALLVENMEELELEDRMHYIESVVSYGCASGVVSGAIYYSETAALFKDNMQELLEFADELKEAFGGEWYPEYETFPNTIVWAAIEEEARLMLDEMEEQL